MGTIINNNPFECGRKLKTGFDYFAKGFTRSELTDAFYSLIADKDLSGLLLESADFCDVDAYYNPEDEGEGRLYPSDEMVLEAVRVKHYAQTAKTMAALQRVLNKHLSATGKEIEALEAIIGKPKKSGLFSTVTVQFPLSDGQTLSIIFHSPENDKMKITAADEILAFRWLLNKRDITVAVAPDKDDAGTLPGMGAAKDVSLEEVGIRCAQLVVKNSDRFQAKSKAIAEAKKALESLKEQAAALKEENSAKQNQLVDLQSEADRIDAGISATQIQLESQKRFNDELRAKLDALKAREAGNAGKPTGEDTTSGEDKAKAEEALFAEKKAAFERELMARGLSKVDDQTYRMYLVGGTESKPLVASLSVNYFVDTVDDQPVGKFTVNAAGKSFTAKGIGTADNSFAKALKAVDAALKGQETLEQWKTRYRAVVDQFTVGDAYRLSRKTFVSPTFERESYMDGFKVTNLDSMEVGGSRMPAVEFTSEATSTVYNIRYDKLQGYLDDGSLVAQAGGAGADTATGTDAGQSPELASVLAILDDIIGGKYTDYQEIDRKLDEAAAELERAGLMEKYDALLNEAADYLTEILRKEADQS